MRYLKKVTAELLVAALLAGAVPLPVFAENNMKYANQEIESVSFAGDFQAQDIPIFVHGMEDLSIEVSYADGSSEIIKNGQVTDDGIYAEIDTYSDPEENDEFCYSGGFFVELYDSYDELLYEDELQADVWNIEGEVKTIEPGVPVSGDDRTYFLGEAAEAKKYIFRIMGEEESEKTFRVNVKASNGKGHRREAEAMVGNWKLNGMFSNDHNVAAELDAGSYFILHSEREQLVDYTVQLLTSLPVVSEVSVDNISIPVYAGGNNWWGLYGWPLEVTYNDGSIQHVYGPRGILPSDFEGSPYTHFDDYGNAFVMKLKDETNGAVPKIAGEYPVIIQVGEKTFEDTVILYPDKNIEEIPVNEAHFPDEVFRRYVAEEIDLNNDGVLETEEIEGVDSISLHHGSIERLEGIEFFVNLKTLDCSENSLWFLDISKNTSLTTLDCSQNNLSSLDISANPDLTFLDCGWNALSTLDVYCNPNLISLGCESNTLSNLDVSGNPNLTTLGCGENLLSILNVSANPALTDLYCNKNCLSALDLTSNSLLNDVDFSDQHPAKNAILRSGNTVSLQEIVGNANLSRITVEPTYGSYNPATGIVTLSNITDTFQYGYDTGLNGGGAVMTVNLKLAQDSTPIPPKPVQVTAVTLSKTALQLGKGQSVQLTASVTPSNAANKTITWKSSSPQTATVDQSGKVTAKAPGAAVITASSVNGKAASCTVTICCKITYKLNKGSNAKGNPQYCYKGKVTLKAPTRKGYVFKGWYTMSKFKGKVSSISASMAKDLTVYAKWEKIKIKKLTITGLKNISGRKAQVKLKKLSGVQGYEILYSTSKKLKNGKKLVTARKNAATLKKLTKNKRYYVKARGYRKDSTGRKVYGAYSGIRSVMIKK